MKKWYIRFYTVYRFFDVYIEDDKCKDADDVAEKYIDLKSENYLKFKSSDFENNLTFINPSSIVAFYILPYAFPCVKR